MPIQLPMSGQNATTGPNPPHFRMMPSEGSQTRWRARAERSGGTNTSGPLAGKQKADFSEYDYFLSGHEIFARSASFEEHDRAGAIWQEGLEKFPNLRAAAHFAGLALLLQALELQQRASRGKTIGKPGSSREKRLLGRTYRPPSNGADASSWPTSIGSKAISSGP